MSDQNWNTFGLFFAALCLLLAAFFQPFAHIQFTPKVSQDLLDAKELIYQVKNAEGLLIGTGVTDTMIEKFFGTELFSSQCETVWETCFHKWLANRAGIQIGAIMISQVVLDLIQQKELLLATMVAFFSMIFPSVKCILGIYLAIAPHLNNESKKRLYFWLETTSKWSFTDPFIIAVMIVIYKADKFNFSLTAEPGIFLFALSGVVSMIGVQQLGKQYGREVIYNKLTLE